MPSQANSLKSILLALMANLAIALAKCIAAVYSGSGAMLAETIHSLADTGNQALLLWGIKSAKKSPDEEHPLGYGKEIYFWSFIVALMLFSVGGMFSIYEGLHKIAHPEAISFPWAVLGVLVFSIAAEGGSFWGCMVEVNKDRQGPSLWQWFRESRKSDLLVVFGEDFAALVGLVLATTAVILTMVTGNPLFDALGSVGIGVLLLVVAFILGAEVKSLLVGQGVEPQIKLDMEAFLIQQPQIDKLFNLLTLQLGKDVMVAVKAKMREVQTPNELIEDINQLECLFKARFSQISWCFFEPDYKD